MALIVTFFFKKKLIIIVISNQCKIQSTYGELTVRDQASKQQGLAGPLDREDQIPVSPHVHRLHQQSITWQYEQSFT